MSAPSDQPSQLRVAIIGAGITGLTLAIGLQARNVPFTIYERATGFREIGAGIGLSPNAEQAMKALSPRVQEAYESVATPNGEDYFQWIDGYKTDKLLFKLYVGEQGFRGCRRSDFLEALAKTLPSESVKFGKQLESIVEREDETLLIKCKDETAETADVVVGCDGIRSQVRQVMFGPEKHASYTGKVCFRALVPMTNAKPALGEYRTSTRFMYNGPNAHAITYPVAMGTMLNILVVTTDPNPWNGKDGKHTAPGFKSEVVRAFQNWHPTVQNIVQLLPDELDTWAIFDMLDNPAPSYARGSVCVAGDAAHAVGPHLGAGAGFGIEDALILANLLQAAQKQGGARLSKSKHVLVRNALLAYNNVRFERTQWLVKNTRDAVDLFQWRDPEIGKNPSRFGMEITWRFHHIWEYNVNSMVKEAISEFEARCRNVDI